MPDVQASLDLAALAVLGLGPRSRNPGEGTFNRSAPGHILEDGICLSCSDDQPDGPMDEATQVLLAAISELAPALRAAFDPSVHPRNPAGSGGGGRFRSNVDRLKDALKVHAAGGGKGDPFEGFDREQLRRVAKSRGIELKRGEGRGSIAQKLLDDLGGKPAGASDEPPKKAVPAAPHAEPKPAPRKRAPRKAAAPKPVAEPTSAGSTNYDGPMFSYSSQRKRESAERLIDLNAQLELLGPYSQSTRDERNRLSREANAIEESGKFTDAELGHIRQQTTIAANTELWRREKRPDVSIDDLHADMAARSKEATAGKPIAVRVTPAALHGILGSGRMKTQFETNRSNGELDPKWRARMEERWFGLGKNSDPAKRPIYGYVAVDGVRSVSGDTKSAGPDGNVLDQYGGIQVILNDDVRSRTTATWGDSLTIPDYTIPEPLNNPTWRSYALPTGGIGNGELENLDRDVNSQRWRERNYVEAQIHGGVSTSDIAEVVLPKADKALQAALDAAGISWRVL